MTTTARRDTGLSPVVGALASIGLRVAVRRWPPSTGATMAREWAAELHAIEHDPEAPMTTRAARALAYAWSLAISRPGPGDGSAATLPRSAWHRPALTFVLMPLAYHGAMWAVTVIMMNVVIESGSTDSMWWHLTLVIAAALALPAAVWLGYRQRKAGRLPAGGLAMVAPAALYAGAAVLLIDPEAFLDQIGSVVGEIVVLVPLVLWAALLGVLVFAAARLTTAGRPVPAAVVGAVGGLFAVSVGVVTYLVPHVSAGQEIHPGYVPLWLPAVLLGEQYHVPVAPGVIAWDMFSFADSDAPEALYAYLPVAATLFALAYTIVVSRPAKVPAQR